MLEKVERTVFFPVVRFVAFAGAVVLFAAIIGGVIFVLTYGAREQAKMKVSFQEVVNTLYPDEAGDTKTPEIVQTLENAAKYLDEDTIRAFTDGRFDTFMTDREKQAFAANLEKIAIEAEKYDPENVGEYVDAYQRMAVAKAAGIDLSMFGELGQLITPLIVPAKKAVRLATVGTALFSVAALFMLFSLIVILLLLFSIERNSR